MQMITESRCIYMHFHSFLSRRTRHVGGSHKLVFCNSVFIKLYKLAKKSPRKILVFFFPKLPFFILLSTLLLWYLLTASVMKERMGHKDAEVWPRSMYMLCSQLLCFF
jgi:hypothetical protein